MQTQESQRSAPPPPRSRRSGAPILTTPDRRYMIIQGRLWRLSNPFLDPDAHALWVGELMRARRAVQSAHSTDERVAARVRVDTAKRALGERGEVWWLDGAPDYNRHRVENTPYGDWYHRLG